MRFVFHLRCILLLSFECLFDIGYCDKGNATCPLAGTALGLKFLSHGHANIDCNCQHTDCPVCQCERALILDSDSSDSRVKLLSRYLS